MHKSHENYKELVWRLAKTDFKLRYHNNALGYVWAIAKPLLMFAILNFVFSSIFNFRNSGTPYYPLELLTALLLFQFFAEGTSNGLASLVAKSQLVTKIYVPKWTIILSATLNSFFIFLTNLVVLCLFFILYHKVPGIIGILYFILYVFLLYVLIIAFSFFAAPLYVRFRDLGTIWEVLLSVLMYASPIIYPLALIPSHLQKYIMINPLAYIIHYSKLGLISGNYPPIDNLMLIILGIAFLSVAGFLIYRKLEKRVAEHI